MEKQSTRDVMKLRDYQQKIVDKVVSSKLNEITIDAPMRSGKSLIISELARIYSKNNTVVVLTEKSALIDQLLHHLKIMHIEPNVVKANKHNDTGSNVWLIMEQSFHDKKRFEYDKKQFKNCVMLRDEGHIAKFGKRHKEILKFLEPMMRVYLSGTPYDEKLLYIGGDYIKEISMKDLIDRGLIKKPKYFIPRIIKDIDYDSISNSGNDYNQNEAGALLSQDNVLKSLVELCRTINISNRYTLFICSSISQAELVLEHVKTVEPNGDVVHSKIDDRTNEERIEAFKKGELKYLVSISKLAIGFDAPIANTLINLRPTKIVRTWKQFSARHLTANGVDEYGELYDFGGCIQELGFSEGDVDFALEPSEVKEKLKKVKPKYIEDIVENEDSEIIEINDEKIKLHIEEINKIKKKNYSDMEFNELRILFASSREPREIAEIANEYNHRKYGWKYRTNTIDVMVNAMDVVLKKLDVVGKFDSTIKAYKTRIKNILNNDKKLASMIYFPEWFYENTREKYPWLFYEPEPGYEEIDIDDEEIPF